MKNKVVVNEVRFGMSLSGLGLAQFFFIIIIFCIEVHVTVTKECTESPHNHVGTCHNSDQRTSKFITITIFTTLTTIRLRDEL